MKNGHIYLHNGHILSCSHRYRILIIGGSGSGKTNTLLDLINKQNDIDKIYLSARDLNEPNRDLNEPRFDYNM